MAYLILDSCIGCTACLTICPTNAVTGEKNEVHKIEGTCIDCGACGRVCPSQAVEDNFGLMTERVQKKDWEKPLFDLDTCMSCGICLDTCPAGALDANMQKVGSSHIFPFLPDQSVCMGCGFCADDCPVGAITMGPRLARPKKPVKQEN